MSSLPLLLICVVSTQITNLWIISLAYRESPAYLRFRMPILVTLRLVRGVIGFIVMSELSTRTGSIP